MTITFPRTLPNNARMTECWFDIVDNVATSPSGKASFMNRSQISDPIWKGNFVTPILERDQRPVWSAWRKSLRGGINTFKAYDVRHAAPLAYPGAKVPADVSGGWSGLATVTALGPSGALALSGLPTIYQFKAGDRIGLEQAGHFGYYEAIEDIAAVGGVVTVSTAPLLHTGYFTTLAVCRVWQAMCQFMIDQNSWVEQGTVQNTPVSFTGTQLL